MKRSVFIGLIILLAKASCHQAVESLEPAVATHSRNIERSTPMIIPSPELSVIDSLMWRQADSALMRLIPWFDTCKDAAHHNATDETFDRHYANLLLSELLYKNDYPQTNRPELQQAVPYFDSIVRPTPPTSLRAKRGNPRGPGGLKNTSPNPTDDLFFLSARAHYINGVGYYEQDSVVQACKEYIQSLEIMEERFGEKELVGKKAQFMALTHTHLAGLFSDLYLHEQAICFGKTAIEYYQKYNAAPWHLAWVLEEIGSQYDMMDCYDSADFYYHKSLSVLPDTNNLIYRDIATHIAYLSYKRGGSSLLSLNQIHNLLTQAENKKEYLSRCLTLGEIYYFEQLFDSASPYYSIVYEGTESVASKKLAAKRLLEISKSDDYNPKTSEYATYVAQFATASERQGALNSDLIELYRQYGQNKAERIHAQRIKDITIRVMWIIGFLVALVLLTLAFSCFVRSRNKRLQAQKQEAEKRLETESYAHRMQQAALSGKLKKSNEALREMKSQIKRFGNTQKPDEAASFVEEPICRLIMERVKEGRFKSKIDYLIYKDSALDKQQLLDLRLAVDRHFGQFTMRLKKAYPELTNSDFDYCCLYLLGLTDADIAALMQRTYNTVFERNGKIRKIFGSENPLPITLMGMAKDSLSI